MKNIKKLLSIVMVLTLVLSLGVSAFAAGTDVTINDKDENSTYTAYQLMTAVYERTDADGKDVYEYHLNETFLEAIKAGVDAVTADAKPDVTKDNEGKVIDFIAHLDAAQIRQFADAAFDVIQNSGLSGVTADGNTFSGLEGYYLIAETVNDGDESTTTSLVMLDTIGHEEGIVIDAKEDRPSSEKKVQETDDTAGTTTDWQDAADYDVGDDVPFQLQATIPAGTTTGYESYALTFHDAESAGLTFNNDVEVSLNGVKLEGGYTVTSSGLSDGCTFEVSFSDIMTLPGFNPAAENVITVNYSAELNAGAIIGSAGNPNEMYLEYSNNPYDEGTGKTPEDKVIVFTFELDVDKVDPNGEALEGAGFTLLKKVATEVPEGASTVKELKDTDENLKAGSYYTDEDGNVYVVVDVIASGSTFTFDRLDSGDYLLAETTVPAGYNAIDPIEITVSATYDTDAADPKLTGLTVTPDTFTPVMGEDGSYTGKIEGDVVNNTGMELPETGGIGTTIFYVVGAILVAGAVIILVTKKRMTGAEK